MAREGFSDGQRARRVSLCRATDKSLHRSHVWMQDFVSDAATQGGALRMLTVLDKHTRACNVLRADRA